MEVRSSPTNQPNALQMKDDNGKSGDPGLEISNSRCRTGIASQRKGRGIPSQDQKNQKSLLSEKGPKDGKSWPSSYESTAKEPSKCHAHVVRGLIYITGFELLFVQLSYTKIF